MTRIPRIPRGATLTMAGFLATFLAACSGAPPPTLGNLDTGLSPCPSTPNCVHTGDRHPTGTEPFLLAPDWQDASDGRIMRELDEALSSLPRTRVVATAVGPGLYLRAEATSRIFRFVDDLELHRAPGAVELAVRSASRVGRSDLGVNADRVEALRERLVDRGVLLAPAYSTDSSTPPGTQSSP